MLDLRPDAYAGTPSFLRILIDKADELGIALPSLKKALVSGEADPFTAEGDEAVPCGPACEGVSAEALVHGMLKRQLPGPGTVILAHQLSYSGHASAGDELVATISVLEKQAPHMRLIVVPVKNARTDRTRFTSIP